jgi:hypothetical protein
MHGHHSSQCAPWGKQSSGGGHSDGSFWQHHRVRLLGWKGPLWTRPVVLDSIWRQCEGHHTRVIVAYHACKNNKKDSRTMYQQQCQYFIMKKKDLKCPSKLFWQHLSKQLQEWRAAGDQIILSMDHNEHTYDGPLGRALADMPGLGLRKAVLHHTRTHTGATFFRGSKPIN